MCLVWFLLLFLGNKELQYMAFCLLKIQGTCKKLHEWTFDTSSVVSCVILNGKKKNSMGDAWLKRGRQDQPMCTNEIVRLLKEQVRWVFQMWKYHDRKGIRKDDKKRHNWKELGRSSSFLGGYYFGAGFCSDSILPYRRRESKTKCLFFSNLSEKTHLHHV